MPDWIKQNPALTLLLGIAFIVTALGSASATLDNFWPSVSKTTYKAHVVAIGTRLDTHALKLGAHIDAQISEIKTSQLAEVTQIKSRQETFERSLKAAKRGQVRINIDVLRGQLWTVQKEIRALQAAGKAIPNSTYREEQRLKTAITRLEQRLAQ